MSLGNPQRHIKFEIASFSHCKNIKGKLLNFGELSWHITTPTFVCQCDCAMGLGKLMLCSKFEVASISHCRNIKGNHKF